MFNEIGDQLNEYDGKVDYENEINNEKDKLKAESEEFINIEIKNQDINVIYRNISDITIKYYLIYYLVDHLLLRNQKLILAL